MTLQAALAELLACPACGTRLIGASCLSCRIDFPVTGGIPYATEAARIRELLQPVGLERCGAEPAMRRFLARAQQQADQSPRYGCR